MRKGSHAHEQALESLVGMSQAERVRGRTPCSTAY
jgi:hypothetical protein